MVFLQNSHGFFTGIGKECGGSRLALYSSTSEASAMPHYLQRNHEELRLACKGFFNGGTSATDTGKQCRGTREVLYSSTPEGDGVHTLHSISAMPYYADRNHEELRLEDYELCKGFFYGGAPATDTRKECRGSRVVLYSSTPKGDGVHTLHSISAMPHYADRNHEELRWEDYELRKGFICGGASATDTRKEFRGNRVVLYSSTPEGDGLHTLHSISAMPHYADRNHEELRWEDYELRKGFICGGASATDARKECRGTRVVLYSSTPKGDGLHTLHSISAMPHYADRNHEELRLEDYELCKAGFTGKTLQKGSIQNEGSAFQQSCSVFGPSMARIRDFQVPGRGGGYKASVARAMGRGKGSGLSLRQRLKLFKCKSRTQGRKSRFWTRSSQDSTRSEESGATRRVDEMIQSISAMPSYEDKSHEMLRLEYYQLHNKGGKLSGAIKYQPLSNCIDANLSQSRVLNPNPPYLMLQTITNTADGASFSLAKPYLFVSPSIHSTSLISANFPFN